MGAGKAQNKQQQQLFQLENIISPGFFSGSEGESWLELHEVFVIEENSFSTE